MTEYARLVTRIERQTYRRLKIEAARSGRTVQELVEEALRALLDAREDHSARD